MDEPQERAPSSLLPTLMSRLGLNTTRSSVEPTALHVRIAVLHKEPSLETLLHGLDDEDESVRAVAVRELEQWGKQVPVDRVVACLHDASWLVREATILTLAALEVPISFNQQKMLKEDEHQFVRESAAVTFKHVQLSQVVYNYPKSLWLRLHAKGAKHFIGDDMDIQHSEDAISQSTTKHLTTSKRRSVVRRIEGIVAALLIVGLLASCFVLAHGYLGTSLEHSDSYLGPPVWTYHNENYRPDQLTWTPDSKHLSFFGGAEETIHVLDITRKHLEAYSIPHYTPSDPQATGQRSGEEKLSPDGQYISIIDNNKGQQPLLHVQVWSITLGKQVVDYFSSTPSPSNQQPLVAWSPNSNSIAVSDGGSTIKLWKLGTQKPFILTSGFAQLASGTLTWSQNGQYLGANTKDGLGLALWNVSTGQRTFVSFFTSAIVSFGLSPDGKLVALATAQKTIQILDAKTGKQVQLYSSAVEDAYLTPQWTNDGTRIIAANEDKQAKTENLRMWDITTGRLLMDAPVSFPSEGMLSPDGKYVAASARNQSTMQVWDTQTGKKIVTRMDASIPLNQLTVWSPNGKYITTVRSDNAVQIWDATTGKIVYTYRSNDQMLWETTWSSDGTYFATLSTTKVQQIFSSSFSMKGCTIEVWHAPN